MKYNLSKGWDSEEEDLQSFIVVREVIGTVSYTVEAKSLQDAISQIERDETENVMDEEVCDVDDFKKGRILSARIEGLNENG